MDLRALTGSMDVYLVDQVQRGRAPVGARVFDAGCGHGRNVEYFLRQGHPVAGIDADPEAVASVRSLAAELRPDLGQVAFAEGRLEDLAGEPPSDLVLCNAVLHFARDAAHFEAMLRGAWSLVAPGGVLFVRLATSIGLVGARPLGQGRHLLPDGSERYLCDRADLARLTALLGAELLDPVKTTLVEELRAMTTWVLGRPA